MSCWRNLAANRVLTGQEKTHSDLDKLLWPHPKYDLGQGIFPGPSGPCREDGAAAELGGNHMGSVVRQLWLLNPTPSLLSFWVENKLLNLSQPWFPPQSNRRDNGLAQLGGVKGILLVGHGQGARHIVGTQQVVTGTASKINIPFTLILRLEHQISYGKELWQRI